MQNENFEKLIDILIGKIKRDEIEIDILKYQKAKLEEKIKEYESKVEIPEEKLVSGLDVEKR